MPFLFKRWCSCENCNDGVLKSVKRLFKVIFYYIFNRGIPLYFYI